MLTNIFIKRIKSLFLLVISIFKRALCCFQKRRPSHDFEPLTQIGVVADNCIEQNEAGYLNEWNEPLAIQAPTSIDEHIQFYRQKTIAARQKREDHDESEEHFFDDMSPTITKQTKLFVNNQEENVHGMNRLLLATDNANLMTKELEEWDDNTGWEDETLNMDTKQALIENRRQARQKKVWEQQQRRHEKFPRNALGEKV